jgi:glyoxalase-like protein
MTPRSWWPWVAGHIRAARVESEIGRGGDCSMDHLVLGVPDLAQGIELVERRTGVRARFGGQHPGRGTHNALLSLGGRQYLEIIARDPDQKDASGLLFPALEGLSEPRFITWAVAVESVADVARRARAANIATVGPLDGSRALSDGSLLTWKTLRIDSPIEGVPFFIEWRGRGASISEFGFRMRVYLVRDRAYRPTANRPCVEEPRRRGRGNHHQGPSCTSESTATDTQRRGRARLTGRRQQRCAMLPQPQLRARPERPIPHLGRRAGERLRRRHFRLSWWGRCGRSLRGCRSFLRGYFPRSR